MKKLLLFSFIILQIFTTLSQNKNNSNIPEALNKSDLVIEAEIINQLSFWGIQHRNIYTSYELKITTVLKGNISENPNLIILGGRMGKKLQIVSTSPDLKIGDIGVFFMEALPVDNNICSETSCNFLLHEGKSSIVPLGNKKNEIEFIKKDASLIEIVQNIEEFTGKKLSHKLPMPKLKSTSAPHTISGFSPKVVTAGTGTIFNIYGSGFGSTRGKGEVWFRYADNANQIFTNSGEFEYIQWADDHIQMVVPPDAATGNIYVNIDSLRVESNEALIVTYNTANEYHKPVWLVDANLKGGYTWHLHNNLNAQNGAKEIIQSSIKDWVCTTSVPWEIGEPKSVELGADGICSIQFGKVNKLDGETLGIAHYFIEATSISNIEEFVLTEVDIVFSDEENWCFDNSKINNEQVDFASVVLHELGHAHLIGHVNDRDDLMHYGLANGEIRNIGNANIECASYILNNSSTNSYGDYNPLIPYENVQPEIIANGDTLFSVNTHTSYQWCDNNDEIANATNSYFIPAKSGSFCLRATNDSGCNLVSNTIALVPTNSEDFSMNEADFRFFPNPVDKELTIQIEQNKFTDILILNALGQNVINTAIDKNQNQKKINLEALRPGIYYISLQNKFEQSTKMFIVK